MPVRHVIALLLLIVAPLVLIGWFGSAALARQQQQQDERIHAIFTDRMRDMDRTLQRIAAGYQQNLFDELQLAGRDVEKLSALRRENPIVRSTLLVDRDGRLVYPAKPTVNTNASTAWHAALSELARNRPAIELQETGTVATGSSPPSKTNVREASGATTTRWQSWFHERGLQLVLWLPRSDRTATGVVLERGRWMADLIDALPDSVSTQTSTLEQGTYQLRDGADRVVYRWGNPTVDDNNQPFAIVRLAAPWNAWHLAYSDDSLNASGYWNGGTLSLVASLLAIAITLILLGTYVLTSMQRQFALADQRVSFASHVSHELRTPLTNIRLYAELAKRDLDKPPNPDTNDATRSRLNVIEEESRRLSRIVSGVLDMVSGKGTLNTSHQSPDDVLRRTLDGFTPSFESLDISVAEDLNANQTLPLDEDVIELVLVNLFSNVEKYAGKGTHLTLATQLDGPSVIVDVIDSGPGIRKADAKRIFQPFQRLDDSLSAPAGTGLGLSIARNAARRHGGDLILSPSDSGAHFRFTFRPLNDAASDEATS